jgi:hypothetical protein
LTQRLAEMLLRKKWEANFVGRVEYQLQEVKTCIGDPRDIAPVPGARTRQTAYAYRTASKKYG